MTYVLYNPLADNKKGKANAEKISGLIGKDSVKYIDITKADIKELAGAAHPDERVILCGGDGTLYHFISECEGEIPEHPIFYYPTGSGNDFMADVRERAEGQLVLLNPYLKNLPTVTVNGKEHLFINGIGYGIDGYCCEEGDKLREKSAAKINYTSIAIKGLLFHFKPRKATVTVDGKKHTYRHVWLAPTMHGRFYGGGMMVAPGQARNSEDRLVSTVVLHCPSKLKTLIVFPSIFKGEHVKHAEMVEILQGHNITVEFDRPTALQIDGETIPNVTEYSVRAQASCSAAINEEEAVAV